MVMKDSGMAFDGYPDPVREKTERLTAVKTHLIRLLLDDADLTRSKNVLINIYFRKRKSIGP